MKHQDSRIQQLLVACPSIEPFLDLDEGPNYILSQLGALLRDRSLDAADEAAVYEYLNLLADEDRETQNLLVVNVFEMLGDTPGAIKAARESLSGNALLLFERVVRGWAPS
jgi:hypothetical protein